MCKKEPTMLRYFLALGSWKLRHNEPLFTEEHWLVLYPLPPSTDERAHTLVVNLQALDAQTAFCLSPTDEQTSLAAFPLGQTIHMPLAVLANDADHWRITHAMMQLTNLDLDNVLFMKTLPEYKNPTG